MQLEEARAVAPGNFFRADGCPRLCLAGLRDFGGAVGWCLRGGRVMWYEVDHERKTVQTQTDEPEWIRIADVEKVLIGSDEVMAAHLEEWLKREGTSLE